MYFIRCLCVGDKMDICKVEKYFNDFHSALNELGIGKGDMIYVSSDVVRLVVQAKRELEITSKDEQNQYIDMLIDELQKHVTEEGTILFPVYSWAFCKGKKFEYYKTQGEVGVLNNYVLNNRKDFKRTYHPMYSLMVWGKYAQTFLDMRNQDAWGEGSPYEFMHKMNACELLLSVSLLRGLTFKHYVEEKVQVPYRHPKYFLAEYEDQNGVTETKCFSMWVRDLAVTLESVQKIDFLTDKGAAKATTFKGCDLGAVYFSKAYDIIADDFLYNNGRNYYKFTDYEIDWNNRPNVYEIGYIADKTLL